MGKKYLKEFRCGFYLQPLKWTVKAETEQEAATRFAKMLKRKRIPAPNGFVVIEIS